MSCQILGSSTLNFIMWHTWINLTSKFIVQETNNQLSPKKHIWSVHWFVVVTNFLSSNCKLEFYCILDQEDWILDKHSYKRVTCTSLGWCDPGLWYTLPLNISIWKLNLLYHPPWPCWSYDWGWSKLWVLWFLEITCHLQFLTGCSQSTSHITSGLWE